MNRWMFEPNGWDNSKIEGEESLHLQDNIRLDDGDQKVRNDLSSLTLQTMSKSVSFTVKILIFCRPTLQVEQ